MGLFGRKKEAEVPPEEPAPLLREDANWHEWLNLGNEMMNENNLPRAIVCWTEAIGRFDGTVKNYEKLHSDISKLLIEELKTRVTNAQIIPAQMLAELDLECETKHPDMPVSRFSEEIFYEVKENLSIAYGPEQAVMMFVCAAYSVIGDLRFSTDPRYSVDKCQEAIRLARYASDLCLGYKGEKYKGKLKPKTGADFIDSFVGYFEIVLTAFSDAIASRSEEELEKVVASRKADPKDLLEQLSGALQLCIHSTGPGHISKKKLDAGVDTAISDCIKIFFSTE